MGRKVYVAGVGMTKFEKPGKRMWDYPDMGKEAAENALADAGIPYDSVEQAAVGYCYGDSTCGQATLYRLGMTGIPVYNVNNNCATGSSALMLGKQLVEGGIADCVLAVGFEKMEKGSLGIKYTDRQPPMLEFMKAMFDWVGQGKAPPMPMMFGNAGREHMERYGTTAEQLAKIALKNHEHSTRNPNSQFQDEYTLEEILAAQMVWEPLTKLQCCPTSDGGAAAVVCSEDFVRKHGLQDQAVEILGQSMRTDFPSTFEEKSCIKLVGADMSRSAAKDVYEQSGLGPEDVDVIELHDCFSPNELISYEALGLCAEGKGGELIDSGAVTYGGKWVVNPSGGLISKGHPLGATGLAQCTELNWQVRGLAGERQVEGAKVGLQHNIGLGGAVVVTMYRKADLAG
jgi:acetyl-CoA acetyltransferase